MNDGRWRWLRVGPLSAIVLGALAFALGMPAHANAALTSQVNKVASASTVITAVTPSVASAAPSRDAEPPGRLPDGLKVGGMKVGGMKVPAKNSKALATFTLAPKEDGLAAAQVVTCYVFDSGPYDINGRTIGFNVDVICNGMVDQIITEEAMVQYASAGGYVGIANSYKKCDLLATDYLPCPTTANCSFAAEYYFGIATVQAFLGTEHKQLSLVTPGQAIPCAV
jgi:hypothetical protein